MADTEKSIVTSMTGDGTDCPDNSRPGQGTVIGYCSGVCRRSGRFIMYLLHKNDLIRHAAWRS